MSSKYFKVQFGYDTDQFIPIDETELEKAIYAHLTGKKIGFENGSVDGNKIISVTPDWNRAMGWNVGYKPTPEEHGEIQATVGKKYLGVVALAKERVQGYIQSGEIDKIGIMPLLESANRTHTQGLTSLGDIIKK